MSDNVRIRRGSDWDEYNSDYNTVASSSQHRSDVRDIWGKSIGTCKMELQIGAGVFAGSYWTDSTKHLKLYSKFKVQADVLGDAFNKINIEFVYNTLNSFSIC